MNKTCLREHHMYLDRSRQTRSQHITVVPSRIINETTSYRATPDNQSLFFECHWLLRHTAYPGTTPQENHTFLCRYERATQESNDTENHTRFSAAIAHCFANARHKKTVPSTAAIAIAHSFPWDDPRFWPFFNM